MPVQRRTLLRSLAAGAAGAVALPHLAGTAAAKSTASPIRDILVHSFAGADQFGSGTSAGAVVSDGALALGSPVGTFSYTDPFLVRTRSYEYATWTSPWVAPGFTATEAVASWNATTPAGTWIQLDLRGVTASGSTTKWYIMGRWAADDNEIARTSVSGQGDADGYVSIDTFVAAAGGGLTSWQLRLTMYRPAGTTQSPTVRNLRVMASRLPEAEKWPTSAPLNARGVVLDVPRYSQEIHIGEYPQWDGGGEAWCSPTSTSMVVAYWGTGPTPQEYSWVDPSYADPWVDHAARNTYDYTYDGCGNWPFNTAYAARYGLDAFVTRMRSFNEVELFIAAGIPVIVSSAFKKNEVPGAGYSTGGHLMVIVGFTEAGDPVMNDPFSPDNASVRKVFGRAEFENAWRNTSGGTVYLIHPASVPLPAAPEQPTG